MNKVFAMMISLHGRPIGKNLKRLIIFLPVLFLIAASGNTKGWYHGKWKELEKAGRFAEAIPLFERAISEFPKEAWFYVYIGHSYLKLRRHAAGIPYLKKAARLAPENAGVLRNLRGGMRSYYYAQWKELEKAERFAAAISVFTQATRDFPGEAWYFVFLGHSQLKMKRFPQGMAQLEKAVRLAPGDAGIRRNLRSGLTGYGSYLRDAGRLEESLVYFERAVAAGPRHPWSYNLLGHALTLAGKHPRAYRAFHKAVRLAGPKELGNLDFKGNLRLGLMRGSAYFRARGDWENVLAYRELGARVLPGYWKNSVKLGWRVSPRYASMLS